MFFDELDMQEDPRPASNPEIKPSAISILRFAFRGQSDTQIWVPLKNNKLNVVRLVYALYNFPGLKEAKKWCDTNIFND